MSLQAGSGEGDPTTAGEHTAALRGFSPRQQRRRLLSRPHVPNPRFPDLTSAAAAAARSNPLGRANSDVPDVVREAAAGGEGKKKRTSPSAPSPPRDERQRRQRREPRWEEAKAAEAEAETAAAAEPAAAPEPAPAPAQCPWNLRSRRPPPAFYDPAPQSPASAPPSRRPLDSPNPNPAQKSRPLFSLALSNDEIEADFLKLSGKKPGRRTRTRRPSALQKISQALFPGAFLSNIYIGSNSNKIFWKDW